MAHVRLALRPALIALAILAAVTAALILLPSASALDSDDPSAGEVRNKGRIVAELPALRTSRSRTFSTDAGTNVTRVYPESVNFRDGGGWELIDNDLEPDPAAGYALENAANDYELSLPDSLADPVVVADGRDRVSFELDGASGAPQAKDDTARYANALPGVDVTYEAHNNAVKEALVLDSPAAGSKYSFAVEVSDGLRARKNDAGGIDFVRDGEVRLSFAPPYMHDSARTPARSERVSFDLRESGSGYEVVLRADADWLNDSDRVYPVTIDPTTYVDTDDDCMMVSGTSANTSFCGYTDPIIQVGIDGQGNVRRGFMRVDTSAVPKTAEILEGELWLNVESGTQRNVDLHRVTRQSTSARTWNKYDGTNAWSTPGGEISAQPDGSNSTFGGTTGVHRINARKLVQGWVDGSVSNYGVVVKDNGSTAGVLNITGDAAANDPMMEIVWAHRTGEQDRWTFATQQLSDRMSLKTNVANGNLILTENDIQIPGVAGHDLGYSRSFNNLELDTNSSTDDLGQYWRGSAGYDVWLSPNGLGTTQAFNGPGDFWAPYDKSGATSFTTPTGMNADLVKNGDGTFKLTYRSSNKKLNFTTTGELSSEEDRNGNKITYAYGATGGKMSAIKDSHDQGTANNTLTFTYTAAGYIDKITDGSSPARVWDYTYSGNKLTSYVNPDGKTTSYSYDVNDNLDKVTDPRGTVTDMDYDTQHRIVSIVRDEGGIAAETRYEYPATVSSQCQDNGDPNDPLDDVVGETIEKDPLWTSGTAHTTRYCWDRLLRVRKTFDGRGESRSNKYTSNSDVANIDSMGAQAWELSYDDDRPKEGAAPKAQGQPAGLKMSYGYPNDSGDPNARSNPLHWLPSSLTDIENKTTEYAYDVKGNLTGVKLPLPGTPTISIAPNANGTTQSITDAKGTGTTSYTYESDGDLDTINRPGAFLLTEMLDYDIVHRLTSHANASTPNVTETYGYDKVDRMTSIAFNAANGVTYGYDNNGNMTTRVDATGTSTYVYDKLNRLTQENLPGGRVNNYTYDGASNLKTLQDSGGTTTYNYGVSNLLDSMQAPGDTGLTSFTYNKDAQRTKTTYPSGVVLTMDYEDKTNTAGQADNSDTGPNRLKSIEAKNGAGTVHSKFTYGYLPDTTLCGGSNADTSLRHQVTDKTGQTAKYCYDALSRLTKASNHNGSNYEWTLDPNGNITKRVKGAATTSYGFDVDNRLCWQIAGAQASSNCTVPSGATTFAYDTLGNLDTSTAGLNLDYNSKGQTTSMTGLSGGTATAMSYAGTNPFERFTAGGATFTNNALGVGAETTGTATTYYRRDNEGGLVSERLATTGNPIHYYAFDGLGSVSALTDSAGGATALYAYEPYGETSTAGGTAPSTHNPWRYASAYLDSTGFYKMGMRYYRPELMRWTQQDPLEQPTDPMQSNRYGYAGADPVNMADPDGTFAIAVPGIAAVAGRVAAAGALAYGTHKVIQYARDNSGDGDGGPGGAEHTKNARPSTAGKHQKGTARQNQKFTDKKRNHKGWHQNPNKR